MTTKAATANGRSREDSNYLVRIDACLREIKALHKDIVGKRVEGRKVSENIRRQHAEIQSILDRVEATL